MSISLYSVALQLVSSLVYSMEKDKYTTKEIERLLRLPMYYGLENADLKYAVEKVNEFYD